MPQAANTVGEIATFSAAPNRIIPPVAKFAQYGQSGRWMSELVPHLATVADDLAFVHGVKVDNNNHGPAVYHTLTGNQFPGSASIGAWVTYGLGSENRDLPGFIVLGDRRGATIGGAGVWGNGFLPAAYQGTLFRNGSTPIVDLHRRSEMADAEQRRELDLLKWLNEKHSAERTNTSELDARIASFELAYRMQTKAPELVDLTGESEATKKLYGLDDESTEPFGRQCLLARRMVERGVRFVQVYSGDTNGWDGHSDLEGNHSKLALASDRPIAGLLTDLKRRGLLKDTLVIWGGEFGRTVFGQGDIETTDKGKLGRDHHPRCFTIWMAGGGIRGGMTFGETDDFAWNVVRDPVHVHDFQATILHLLGIDHERLTFKFQGRHYRLTDVHGEVVQGILA
jgi:hypothetical protein